MAKRTERYIMSNRTQAQPGAHSFGTVGAAESTITATVKPTSGITGTGLPDSRRFRSVAGDKDSGRVLHEKTLVSGTNLAAGVAAPIASGAAPVSPGEEIWFTSVPLGAGLASPEVEIEITFE